MITFTVFGTPVPQGSLKAFGRKRKRGALFQDGRIVVTHDNPNVKLWRHDVVAAALAALAGSPPIEESPLELHVMFFLPRPASAPKRVVAPAKKPDCDKLLRAVMDALTAAGVWRDDAQVTDVHASKAFAGGVCDPHGPGGIPRAVVQVYEAKVFRTVAEAQRIYGTSAAIESPR